MGPLTQKTNCVLPRQWETSPVINQRNLLLWLAIFGYQMKHALADVETSEYGFHFHFGVDKVSIHFFFFFFFFFFFAGWGKIQRKPFLCFVNCFMKTQCRVIDLLITIRLDKKISSVVVVTSLNRIQRRNIIRQSMLKTFYLIQYY